MSDFNRIFRVLLTSSDTGRSRDHFVSDNSSISSAATNLSSATSGAIETEVTEEIGQSEEERKDGDHVRLTSARAVGDVNQKPILTLQAATTVPESERTAIPAAGKTVNGIVATVVLVVIGQSAEAVRETGVTAADAISMTDLGEIYSMNDPDVAAAMTAETVVTRNAEVTEGVEQEDRGVIVGAEARHHRARKSPPQT